MLTITKNKSKSSMATVKFSSVKKTPPVQPRLSSQPLPQPLPQPQTSPRRGVQSTLTEDTFSRYLQGYVQFYPVELPKTIGNKIRYAIDTIDSTGHIISTKYRLGGFVKSVSPDISSVVLFNPYAKKQWILKIQQPRNRILRLWYARRAK